MSVAEQLRAFRYATSSREIPWTHLRSVDVAAHRVREPDLHLMKNLVSLLSDCNLATAASHGTNLADVYQLLSELQLALQFTLWSQSVLKEQLAERQSGAAVQQINSQYVEKLEKKLETSRQEVIKLREERDNFQLASRSLEHRLTQTESTIRCLEKDLEFERQRLKDTVTVFATRLQEQSEERQKEKKRKQQQQQEQQEPLLSLSPSTSPPYYYSQRCAGETPHEEGKDAYTRNCRQDETSEKQNTPNDPLIQGGASMNPTALHVDKPACVGKQYHSNDQATFLQHLPFPNQDAIYSPPLATAHGIPRKLKMTELPSDILNALNEQIKEAQAQIVATSEAACRSLERAVEGSLQRTEAVVKRAEQYIDSFQTSLLAESQKRTAEASCKSREY